MKLFTFETIDSEHFVNLKCDIETALKIEQLPRWFNGEPVNTDNGVYQYEVHSENVNDTKILLINNGFKEV